MSLKVYRIDRSLFGKLNNKLKSPDLPVMGAFFLGNPFKNYKDYKSKDFFVLSKDDEIARFTEVFNDEWVNDVYYIRHPKKIKTDILIPASEFHSYIMREQLADIVSYIRANLRVTALDIEITRKNGASVSTKGVFDGIQLEGKATLNKSRANKVTIQCDQPLKVSEKRQNYIWMDEFPHIVAMLDEADEGTFTVSESYDLSFGLGLDLAEQIGVDLEWNDNFTFNFMVKA